MSSNTPKVPLQFSDPPATDLKASNCIATLTWLKANLATIYAEGTIAASSRGDIQTLTRKAYLNIYSTTHSFCMDAKQTPKRPSKDALDGGDLYRGIRDEIVAHCLEVRILLLASPDNNEADDARSLVEEYLAHWQMLIHLAALVSHLLQPLERDWISRSISESRRGILLIQDLHTQVWKDEILQIGENSTEAALGTKLISAMDALQAQGEEGAVSHRDLAKRFKESLTSIRVEPVNER